jgi:hypothetical protein
MAEQNRNTVLAIMEETTEGTAVVPAAATDYVAIQDDLDFTADFAQLSNAELRSSIGEAKSIIGKEQPKAQFSHYLRHSGVEGQAPNFKKLLKAAFGTEVVAGTQYTTASSSTASVVKVGSGNGVNFQRGQAMLVKDGTNGYSIRNVLSVATDDITPAFNLPASPASGIGLGKAVLYKPANTGHPTLSLWNYRANRAAIEMLAGARVTSMSVGIRAGELINCQFQMEGTSYSFNPIAITASNNKLDFTDDNGTFAATIPAAMYKSPIELASAIQAAMQAVATTTPTCTYSSTTGKFTIKATGTLLSLLFATGTNTANTIATTIGFTATDKTGTGATTGYTSNSAISLASPYTPSLDSADPNAAKNDELLIGDATNNTALAGVSSVDFSLGLTRQEVSDVSAVSGVSGSIINARSCTVKVTAILSQYDADKFDRYVNGTNIQFAYSFGVKSGGNWVPGKCANLFIPSAVISSHKVNNDNGLLTLELELKAYVDNNGNGEVYLNFV